jgi:hypothetical protein
MIGPLNIRAQTDVKTFLSIIWVEVDREPYKWAEEFGWAKKLWRDSTKEKAERAYLFRVCPFGQWFPQFMDCRLLTVRCEFYGLWLPEAPCLTSSLSGNFEKDWR